MLDSLKKIVLFIFPLIKILALTFPFLIILLYIIKHDSRNFNKEVLLYVVFFELFALIFYLIIKRLGWVKND